MQFLTFDSSAYLVNANLYGPPFSRECLSYDSKHQHKIDRGTYVCATLRFAYRLFVVSVRKLGNFRYILIPEIINKFMTIISDPVRTEHVHVFKLNLK
jgi:hypothetical protein